MLTKMTPEAVCERRMECQRGERMKEGGGELADLGNSVNMQTLRAEIRAFHLGGPGPVWTAGRSPVRQAR